MRPIDADVLKQHIDKLPALPDGNFAGNHSALKALINMQPTIQPVATDTNVGDTISRQATIDALDTAIEHYDGIAEECRKKADIERNDYMDMRDDAYEAQQLAQWLNELKYLREKIEQLTIKPEPTDEQVEEYCKKRCLHVVTDDYFRLVQPEPQEGHWILHESPDGGEQYECSLCGVLWEFTDGTPEDNEAYFCPKCGTKMKGVKHERTD